MKNKALKRRILDISYKKRLSHLGSCLTVVDLIDLIYEKAIKSKQPFEFVLSSGHAALAWYVVLEKYYGHNAEQLFDLHGVHPNRDVEHHMPVSSGSLGHGIGIATGMAIADRSKKVYVLISDGETFEGSVWEALSFIERHHIWNIEIHVNANGWGAYDLIDAPLLHERLMVFFSHVIFHNTTFEFPFLEGQSAHYMTLNKELYELSMEILGRR